MRSRILAGGILALAIAAPASADNGYGAEENSKDFLLRAYRITPEFTTARGGDRTIKVGRFVSLRDPDGHVPFTLERSDRRLTGGDFDIESMRIHRHADSTAPASS